MTEIHDFRCAQCGCEKGLINGDGIRYCAVCGSGPEPTRHHPTESYQLAQLAIMLRIQDPFLRLYEALVEADDLLGACDVFIYKKTHWTK